MLSTVRSASLLAFSIVAVAACGSTTGTDLFSGAASSSGAGGASSTTTSTSVVTTATTTASATPDVVSTSTDATATSVTSSVSSSMDATGSVATTSTGETATVSTSNSTGSNSTGSNGNCSTCAEIAQGQGDPGDICPGSSQTAFANLYDCLCQSPAGCKYVCSNNACVGGMASQACGGCIQISCASQVNNCAQN